MACILFTWEIGEGTGHVLPALPILRQFQSKGHQVVAALRDVRACGGALRAAGIRVVQAPLVPMPTVRPSDPEPDTLAHILQHHGFRSADELHSLALSWVELIRLLRPQQVVASYAPVSLLTAKAMGLATTLLALPFELPPKQHPLPSLRTGRTPQPGGESPPVDDQVLAVIAAALARGGFDRVPPTRNPADQHVEPLQRPDPEQQKKPVTPKITELHQLFGADSTYLMSIPVMDMWPRESHIQYIGDWLWGNSVSKNLALSNREIGKASKAPHVFVYLPADLPNLEQIRQQLNELGCTMSVVIRGADDVELKKWQTVCSQAQSEHTDLAQALEKADVLITHAGHSTVCQAMLARVPMVLIPRSLETYHTAQAAVRAGMAVIFDATEHKKSGMNTLQIEIEKALAFEQSKKQMNNGSKTAKGESGVMIAAEQSVLNG